MELRQTMDPVAEMMASAAGIAGMAAAKAMEHRKTTLIVGAAVCGVAIGAAVGIHFMKKRANRYKHDLTPSV